MIPARRMFPILSFLILLLLCFSVDAEEIPLAQEVQGFSFTGYSKEGKREWEVYGATATIEGDIASFEKPRLESAGETSFTVTSDRGKYDRQTAIAYLEKNVFAETSDGTTLRTESLEWHGPTKKISTEDYVIIKKGTFVSQGKGAEIFPDLKKLELKESVTVEMDPDIQITSEGPMELDYSNNIAVFRENVKILDGEGELLADRMDVYFDPDTGKVHEIIATGNVQIKRGESISYSEKAIYDADLRKVTLTGRPRLFIQSKEAPLSNDPFLKRSKQ